MNNLREAYEKVYAQLDERMSDDEKEMRRLAAKERRAGNSDRMDSKVASKYADSEAKSADKEDKKSKGKYIHGMADSVEVDGDLVDEAVYGGKKEEPKDTRMVVTNADKKGNTKAWQNYKAGSKKYKAADHVGESAVPGKPAERLGAVTAIPKSEQDAARERIIAKTKAIRDKKKIREEIELDERALDTAEKGEKERLVQGMKKSAAGFKKRYGERAKSVMYATATKQAKRNMDTSKSDRRYGVEG
jgi:hypothetical protein